MTYQPPKMTPTTAAKTAVAPKKNNVASLPVKTTPKTTTTSVPVVVEKTALQIQLEEMVAAQLTDRQFAPITYEGLSKQVTYVTASNGLFKVTKTPIGLFKEQQEEFKTPVIGLPKMEAGVDLIIPKIPFKYIIQALSYYKDINTKDRTEASLLYFWNHLDKPLPNLPGLSAEGRLVTYCPIQVNSGALSDFTKDTNVAWMRQNLALLLESHSHNTMSAFFSGTDDANENMTQFYAVWGKVTSDEPDFAFRYVVGDSKIECDPSMLFEWPTLDYKVETTKVESLLIEGDTSLVDLELTGNIIIREGETSVTEHKKEILKGPFKMVEYPEAWMTQHSKEVYVSPYGANANAKYGWGYDGYGGYGYDLLDDDYSDYSKYAHARAGKEFGVNNVGKKSASPSDIKLDNLRESYEEVIMVTNLNLTPVTDELKEFAIDVAKTFVSLKESTEDFE